MPHASCLTLIYYECRRTNLFYTTTMPDYMMRAAMTSASIPMLSRKVYCTKVLLSILRLMKLLSRVVTIIRI